MLQADVDVAFQASTGAWNVPHLQLFAGGIDTDVREIGLNGHRLTFVGGVVIAGVHGGISSYGGIDLGGGTLEFHDFVSGKDVYGAGFADSPGAASRPEPTGPPKGTTLLYLRGEGTMRWQTLSQQCLSPKILNHMAAPWGPWPAGTRRG